MIEPQNTMLPLAESRPVDTPQGEGEGFSEMLAQSLGMVNHVDPNAVQQINTNPGQQGQAGEGAAEEESPFAADAETPAVATAAAARQTSAPSVRTPGHAVVATPGPAAHDRADSPQRGAFRAAKATPRTGVIPTLPTPPRPDVAEGSSLPSSQVGQPPVGGREAVVPSDPPDLPVRVGHPIQAEDPGNSIWKPAPEAAPVDVEAGPPTGDGATPVDLPTASGRPSVPSSRGTEAAPGTNPPLVDRNPATETPAGPEPVTVRDKSEITPVAVEGARTIPRPPSVDAGAPVQPAREVRTPPSPRVDLLPDRPVRIENSRGPVVPQAPTAEPATPGATEPLSIPAPLVDIAGPAVTGSAPEILRPQASALAERVMQAIDMQQNQPPPRSMVVDIPEVEGLRLVVSVRSAGHVAVTPASGSTNPDAFATFANDLSRVLAERGFVMTGDGRGRGYNPYANEEPAPATRRSASFRRPARTDNDLRI